MNAKLSISLFAGLVIFGCAGACRAEDVPPEIALRLARELSEENDYPGAATEFRRLALADDSRERTGGFLWFAAYEYWRGGDDERGSRMLDRAEDAAPDLAQPALLLRGELADKERDYDAGGFFFGTLLGGAGTDPAMSGYAARRLAVLRLRQGDLEGARKALESAPDGAADPLRAMDRYRAGRDKKPLVGGFLGMVPGLGYVYAGEYANAVRSLILNAIFIYGMVDTAQEDQWGAFTVITFFELTWYSGSIYGGIDASHRYNRRRLEEAIDGIQGRASFQPDYNAIPAVKLRFVF